MNLSKIPVSAQPLAVCLAAFVCFASLSASSATQSRFDDGLDGWSLAAPPTSGAGLEWQPAGGDPGGFARVEALVDLAGVVTTLADSGAGSLRGLVANPAVSRITFAPALSGQTIVLGGTQILIDRNVIIDASALAGGISISGNSNGDTVLDPGESRIFEIAAGNTVTLRGLHLRDGHAVHPGGGAILNYGDLIIEDCKLSGNRSSVGGAIFGTVPGSITIHRSQITANHAGMGAGGIYSASLLEIHDSTFSENTSPVGGGLFLESFTTIYRTTFSDNHVTLTGGAIYNDYILALVQCTFSGNSAGGNGGAIYNQESLELVQTTISGNTAGTEGGGISHNGYEMFLTHSIVAGNTAPLDANVAGTSGLIDTLSLTTGDPMLAPLGDFGGLTQTMPPLAGSPAIDGAAVLATPYFSVAVETVLLLPTPLMSDQRGFPLGLSSLPDIGAVEFGDIRVYHFVDAQATGANDGTSWADAFTDLSAALAAATAGDEIWVAEGVYTPGSARTDTFQLKPQVAVYGGFSGSETARHQRNRDPATNGTVLSGDIGVPGDFSDNVYHVVNATGTNAATVLSGFTITGGNADAPGTDMPARGAGLISITSGSPTLEDLRFVGNRAAYVGGAVYLNASSPTFTRVVFADNATTAGRGTAVDGFGGAVYANNSSPVFIDCRFVGNHSPTSGGAVHLQTAHATFTNCLFTENTAGANGGAVQVVNSSPTFINATVSANSAGANAGGILHTGTGTTTLINSIVWNNTDTSGSTTAPANLSATAPALQSSLVQGRNPGGANLDGTLPANAPAFIAPALGDFRLGTASPARNAGNNAANPRLTDLAGQRRILGGTIDLGAYEGARDVTIEIAAPAHFLGHQSHLVGGRLRLSSRLTSHLHSTPNSGGAILLTGAGITLRYDLPDLIPDAWQRDVIKLAAGGGWFIGNGTLLPSAEQITTVLGNVTSLRIRFPLRSGLEQRSFDRIILSPPLEPIEHFRFGDNPVSPGIFLQTFEGAPLTAIGVSQYALPITGPGSAFPNPVTRPGLLNTQAADFGLAAAYDAARVLYAAETVAPTFATAWGSVLTVEAFVHATSLGATHERIIAAHGFDNGAGSSQPAWSFGVAPTGALVFRANATGSPAADAVYTAPFTLETGRDYYVAATFDAGVVTFLLQNFTAGTVLTSATVAQPANGTAAPATLFDPAAPIRVGNTAAGDRAWHGLIDEVRVHAVVLDAGDLLVAPFDTSQGLIAWRYFFNNEVLDLSTFGGTVIFQNSWLSGDVLFSPDFASGHNLAIDQLTRVRYRLDMPGIVGGGVNDLIQYRDTGSVADSLGHQVADFYAGPNFGPGTFRLIDREAGTPSHLFASGTIVRLGDVPEGYSYELVRDTFESNSDRFTKLDMIVRPARTLTSPILAASDAELGETGLDLGFKGGSLHLTESFTSSDRRLFIHEGHDAVIEVDAGKTVDWNGTTLNFGRLIKRGEGTLNLADGISHYGQIHLDGGMLTGPLKTAPRDYFFSFNGGGYRFEEDIILRKPIHFGPEGGTVDVMEGLLVRSEAAFTGTGPITKTGPGTFRTPLSNAPETYFTVNEGTLEFLLPGSRTIAGIAGTGNLKVDTSLTSPRRTLLISDTLALEGNIELGNANLRIESGDKPPMVGPGNLVGFSGNNTSTELRFESSADFTFGKNLAGNLFRIYKSGTGTMAFEPGLNYPIQHSNTNNVIIHLEGGGLTIPPDLNPFAVYTYPGTELLVGTSYIENYFFRGGTVRFGPGFVTFASFYDEANSDTRFVMKLSQPGVYGQGVNDMISRNYWLDFNPVFDIEAHPGFGPGRYRLLEARRGSFFNALDSRSLPPTLGDTPNEFNYSYQLDIVDGYLAFWGYTIGLYVDLIVTANPESYTEWMEQRFFAAGTVPAPWDESLSNGLGSNALAYFFGLNPLSGEVPETMSFRGLETITPEVAEGEEPAEPVTYARVRFRKNHHFGDANFTWVLQSSQTLAEDSWASHPDLALEWISLTGDGEATVWEALVHLEADQTVVFFRILVEVDVDLIP